MLFKLAKTWLGCVVCLVFLMGACGKPQAVAASLPVSSKVLPLSLPDIVRQTIAIHFAKEKFNGKTLDQFADSLLVAPAFRRPAGLFVTLSYRGKTRACWGSIQPSQENIVKQTVVTTLEALTKEYRYRPVSKDEWKRLKPQVTVVTGVEPIASMAFQNPLRDGLLVRSGGKAGVYLPGEAADAHYQLVHCKLKAGIKANEPCQLYRLRTEIYE